MGRQDFLIDRTAVRCVVPLRDMRSAAHPLPWVSGVLRVNDWDLPVIDLRAKLGLPTGPRGRQPVIVVLQMHRDEGPRWLGLIAERAGSFAFARGEALRSGALRRSGRMLRYLDLDVVLPKEDLRALIAPFLEPWPEPPRGAFSAAVAAQELLDEPSL